MDAVGKTVSANRSNRRRLRLNRPISLGQSGVKGALLPCGAWGSAPQKRLQRKRGGGLLLLIAEGKIDVVFVAVAQITKVEIAVLSCSFLIEFLRLTGRIDIFVADAQQDISFA